jgi:8-oxo-dGTP diphosphatase
VVRRLHRLLLSIYRRLPVVARRRVVRSLTPAYTVGAICFVERSDGALLLVRLSYRNRWGAPGGLLKRGEEPSDAARREVLEEVGLDVTLLGEPAVVVDAGARRVDVVFRGRLGPHQDPAAARASSPEIVEVRWFPPDELPELQIEASSALVALARSARAPQAVPLPAKPRARDRDDRDDRAG